MSRISKTIAITTLGCKVNQYDSAAFAQQLQEHGFSRVPFDEKADCYIINTCAVTAPTEAQSRQLIRRALRRSQNAPVIVTGCYAQKNADFLQTLSARITVTGNAEKNSLPALVKSLLKKEKVDISIQEMSRQTVFTTPEAATFSGRTRAFLKIQDGCNSRCAYCIVPSVRGPSRSLPLRDVLGRMHTLVENGYREIVFTGIHLGAWGLDLDPGTGLEKLLNQCESDNAFEGIRLRLSSVEPTEWTDGIIDLIARSKKICPHVHIPLQSGNSDILKAMRRPYSPEFFYDLVVRLARTIPDINIGIDVIAGFPGETDMCFESTYRLLESLPAGYLHVFPFSRRPGTAAAVMSGQVPVPKIRERLNALRQLSDRKKQGFYSRYTGTRMEVLVEGCRDRTTGFLRAITPNYIPVLFEGDDSLSGTLQQVVLERVDGDSVAGRLA